jgi:hypothetical protein
MIAREWLTRQIEVLNVELGKARRRREDAVIERTHAIDRANAAIETEQAIDWCLRAMRDELESRQKPEIA